MQRNYKNYRKMMSGKTIKYYIKFIKKILKIKQDIGLILKKIKIMKINNNCQERK